jgi:subtilase family serine protease
MPVFKLRMYRGLRVAAIALTVVVVVSSLGFVAARPASAVGPSRATPPVLQSDATPLPAGAAMAPLGVSNSVLLSLTLAPTRPAALSGFLSAVENPQSPLYRHFLSYSEFVSEFAPSPSTAGTVEAALTALGGRSVTVFPDRSAVSALLTPAEVRSAFGVQLVEYGRSGALPLYTAVGTLSMPAELRGLVTGVNGLSDRNDADFTLNLAASTPRPLVPRSGLGSFVYDNSSGNDWSVGSDYTQVFGATQLLPGFGSVPAATYPQKVAIATLLAGGYNATTGQNLPPWDPAVVDAYFNETFPASWPKPHVAGVPVGVGSGLPPPPGSFGGLNDSTLDEIENSLDLEMAGSMAPGATVVNFYLPGSLLASPPFFSSLADDFAQSLSDALAYNYLPARLAVVSGSFGLPDLNDTLWNHELDLAAATGVTVVASSGDQGNAPDKLTGRDDGPWPVWPASAAFNDSGALSVGGVSLSMRGTPTTYYNGSGSLNLEYDSNISSMADLSAWYDVGKSGQVAGTEGGASVVFPESSWQVRSAAQPAIVNATVLQGAPTLGRAGPDVALSGNRTVATVAANATGAIFFEVLEGTSVAAPLVAGLLADVVGVESNRLAGGWAPLGFLDPEVYRIGSYYAAHPSDPTDPFTDVTQGRNYVFSAAPGWDATTGWGLVNAPRLLAADGNATVRGYVYPGPTIGLPPRSSPPSSESIPWTTIYLIFGAGIVAAVVLVVLMARPNRPRDAPKVPYGVQGGGFGPGAQGGVYPGATFLCPYCGTIRPAEAGRCPQCGAF